MRIGMINWDSSLPGDTYFGHYTGLTLSPEKYRSRVPYYAKITENGVTFPRKSMADAERELQYAINAGIDYFAYCWYSDEADPVPVPGLKASKSCVDPVLWELNHMRKLHMQSPLREKIHLCAIILCSHFYSKTDMRLLADAMQQPYYETVDGRPLVFLFGGYRIDYIHCLRVYAKENGGREPYFVFFNNSGPENLPDYREADAVCDYACVGAAPDYPALCDICIRKNREREKYGIPVFPHFTLGWDPSPRIEAPVPWTSYPRENYAPPAKADEIFPAAVRFAEWMRENRENTVPNEVLVFAWNEFEEGGFLCPTLAADGTPDERRLRAFSKVSAMWKK